MMQARWIKHIGAAGAVTLAVIGASTAQAQDDSVEGNSIWNLEQRVWGGIVRGLGLKDPNAPTIDYRERSPLVVPPSRDLPPPQARVTPRDPSWPTDPDAARAKSRESTRKTAIGNASTAIENQGAPISPAELDRGVPRQGTQSTGSNVPASGADGRPVAPSELGYFGGLFSGRAWGFGSGFGGYKDETGTFTNEPQRSQLTEPPPGYQTPSADQPYGVTRRIERSKVEAHDPAGRGYGR
jgi:hypothetical protein